MTHPRRSLATEQASISWRPIALLVVESNATTVISALRSSKFRTDTSRRRCLQGPVDPEKHDGP
jgi:hypothetical protein